MQKIKTSFALVVILLITSLHFQNSVFSETVVLKSGKTIEGKIAEKTAECIKIDIYGVPVTYYLDEIESIDGEKLVASPSKEIVHSKEVLSSREDTANASKKCFLWEVNLVNSKVYILGSIHVAKPDMYPLNEKIEDVTLPPKTRQFTS
jgi:hypothetical protein